MSYGIGQRAVQGLVLGEKRERATLLHFIAGVDDQIEQGAFHGGAVDLCGPEICGKFGVHHNV